MISIDVRSVEIETNEVIIGRVVYPNNISPVDSIPSKIRENYVLVPSLRTPTSLEFDCAIAMQQTDGGLNWFDMNKSVMKNGYVMPTIDQFMRNYNNVTAAARRETVLYGADGRLIEDKRLEQYRNKLNFNCWIQLNAMFVKGQGFLDLDLAILTGFDKRGEPIYKKEPLEDCVQTGNYCLVDLDSLNKQGLPTIKSNVNFERGKNIYFWSPKENSVARFLADSDGVVLYCSPDPTYSNSNLMVCRAKNL
jgi:hypothetical protein